MRRPHRTIPIHAERQRCEISNDNQKRKDRLFRTVPSARADLISNIVELAWLTRYPLPSKVIVDRGNKFLADFKTNKPTTILQ